MTEKEVGIQFPGGPTPEEMLKNRLFNNSWPKTELEHFAKTEIDSLTAENARLKQLMVRYRICVTCGQQLSQGEYDSVHTCYAEKEGD